MFFKYDFSSNGSNTLCVFEACVDTWEYFFQYIMRPLLDILH